MTPAEYAKHLVLKFDVNSFDWGSAKKSALLCVDEILYALKYDLNNPTNGSIKYYTEVREELLKM